MSRRPPRLLVRMMLVTFVTAAVLVGAVFSAVWLNARRQVRQTVREQLESGQRLIATLQSREERSLRMQAETLVESPTLKAAVDTYAAEARYADDAVREQLVETIASELAKMATRLEVDALIMVDAQHRTLAAVGRSAGEWPHGVRLTVTPHEAPSADGVVHTSGGVFRLVSAAVDLGDGATIGELYLATSLDTRFATRLGELARTQTAIVSRGTLIGSTLNPSQAEAFAAAIPALEAGDGILTLGREAHAYRRLGQSEDTAFYALASIDALATASLRNLTASMVVIGVGALSIALLLSLGLAHFLSRPIGDLSASIQDVAESRKFSTTLPLPGTSRELDALTATFNTLMASVAAAEDETQVAYTAAIRGLAAALDARDPYTAGHSERVSALSVEVGRVMQLDEEELEVVRLGALLHDIGKIGVPDEILRKPAPLEPAEYETLKQHTVLGARILGTIPFLARHVAIVELHHERPDGGGYPHGLRGDDIPLGARIVHVADAYDAMTSARAYRPERPSDAALRELWNCVGCEFDAEVVQALTLAVTGRAIPPAFVFPERLSA